MTTSRAGASRVLPRSMAAWLCAFSLAACTHPEPEPIPSPEGSTAPTQQTSNAKSATAIFIRGYYESREGGLFTACGETSRRHVQSIDEKTLASLDKAGEAAAAPLFLVARGDLVDRDSVSIGAFDLITGDAWNCESKLDGFVAEARGNDVLWSLDITTASVRFSAAPDSPPKVFAYQPLKSVAGSLSVDTVEGDDSIQVRLDQESCSERMTGTIYGWSASVIINGQRFSGCAWRGSAVP